MIQVQVSHAYPMLLVKCMRKKELFTYDVLNAIKTRDASHRLGHVLAVFRTNVMTQLHQELFYCQIVVCKGTRETFRRTLHTEYLLLFYLPLCQARMHAQTHTQTAKESIPMTSQSNTQRLLLNFGMITVGLARKPHTHTHTHTHDSIIPYKSQKQQSLTHTHTHTHLF